MHDLHALVRRTRNDARAPVLSFDVPLSATPALARALVRRCAAIPAALALLLAVLLPAAAGAQTTKLGNGKLVYQASGSQQGTFFLRTAAGKEPATVRASSSPVEHPAVSPLGRRIAFSSGGQLWIVGEDGTMLRQLTSDPLPSGSPAWSPDGTTLIFARGAVGARDLYALGADGNDLRRLTLSMADESSPAWSSTGRIAFVRRTPAVPGSKKRRRPANDDVFVMRADGSGLRQITREKAHERDPAWSPDGKRIAFTRVVEGRAEVFVANANGTKARRLTRNARATSPVWSPDGRYLAYSGGTQPRRSLFVLRVPASSKGKALPKRKRATPASADAVAPSWLPANPDPVIAIGGDIACDPDAEQFTQNLQRECHQMQTSDLLLKMDLWAILALGDLQYPDGVYDKIQRSFAPSWGRLKELIRPSIGNHDYRDPGANGLYDYFYGPGTDAGPYGSRGTGYYSFDIGAWHVIALDTDCSEPFSAPETASCAAGSPQEQWLRADLAAHPAACTIAFMHHPYVSSGLVTTNQAVRPLWQALYDANADIVVAGHDHAYERFASQDPAQTPDAARGIREFVVGTGGKSLQGPVSFLPNSVTRNGDTFGVLKMTLRDNSYDWEFVPDLSSGSFTDSGTATCH